jgi:hypothetical protein
MNLRTTFTIDPSKGKINYNTPVMFIGSCFASEIGSKMAGGKMPVFINPTGVVYNPASVGSTIDLIIQNRIFSEGDLYNYNGLNLSFSHYTDFTSEDISKALSKINDATSNATQFLRQARYLIISFGTARIYRFRESGAIVSNCHKLPAALFSKEILTVDEIISDWQNILKRLHSFNSNLRVIFTISPVRHWKDGAHGNQLSKSILFLAVEKLLEDQAVDGYFPAYELVMDDLRDYRFYAEDMLHPSPTAVNYIWKAFSDCYFDSETVDLWKEIQGISKATKHRFISDSATGRREFINNILEKISALEKRNPYIDLGTEKSYFLDLASE